MSTIMVNISGNEGEATLDGYKGQIECLSMRHAIELPIVSGTTRSEGLSRHGPIELIHTVDKSSPTLRFDASKGTKLGNVVISRLRMVGGQMQAVETITLTNAVVVRVDTETPIDPSTNEPGDELLETFALEYSDIAWDQQVFVNNEMKGTVRGNWSGEHQKVL